MNITRSTRRVCVVLPAGGTGVRMGLPIPKQFCCVRDRPVVSYTIEAFERIPWVEHVVVAVSPDNTDYMLQLCQKYSHSKVRLTEGGSTRHRSIFNGVKVIAREWPDCDVVVVHDGVRPLIQEKVVDSVVEAAREHGAAGVVRPLVSTIVASNSEGFLEESLDRCRYRASEMPQAFRLKIILQAYQQSTDYDLDYGTECLHLAEKYTEAKVRVLDGPDYLWKITYKKDLYAFKSILEDQEKQRPVYLVVTSGGEKTTVLSQVQEQLQKHEGHNVVIADSLESLPSDARNLVLCSNGHSSNSADALITQCHQSLERLHHLDACLVCVLNVPGDLQTPELLQNLREGIECLGRKCRDSVVYGIITKGLDVKKLTALLSTLIQERKSLFSGQTFVV